MQRSSSQGYFAFPDNADRLFRPATNLYRLRHYMQPLEVSPQLNNSRRSTRLASCEVFKPDAYAERELFTPLGEYHPSLFGRSIVAFT